MMARFEVVKQFSRLSHQGNLKEASSLLLREIFCEFVMILRFPFCQRDPCLLPIFLLCLIEDFDFEFHLSYDFVTLILRPVYFLHLKNKAMTNTHSNFSKIAQNIPVTTLHYSNPASMSSSCLNFSWKYRLSCNFQEYWQC